MEMKKNLLDQVAKMNAEKLLELKAFVSLVEKRLELEAEINSQKKSLVKEGAANEKKESDN
jgi:hypothetical protein